MPIILDPKRQFVSIDIFYIEEEKKHGNSVFHFINSQEEFDYWKEKEYKTEEETEQLKAVKPTVENQPGMPISQPTFDPAKIIHKIVTTWRRMTWKDQNTIFSRCLKIVPGPDNRSTTELDTIQYRDMKLKMCLKKWDLKDEGGSELKVTDEVIDQLVPEVAQELISSFEKVTEATGEDLKN